MEFESPFRNDNVLEFLQKEMEEVGVSLEKLIPWMLDPPRLTTFRVNTLETSVADVKILLESALDEASSERELPHRPKVWVATGLNDMLVIDSWNARNECVPRTAQEDGGTRRPVEIIVDAACGAAVLRGAHVFAPGILAMPKGGVYLGNEVEIYADIEGRCLQGLAVKYEGRKRFVGRGNMKMERREIFGTAEPPRGVAVEVTATPSGCVSVSLPPELGILQNLPSALAVFELGPRPGECVLDMCAAPGNKTSHLAALMCNQGVLVAIDRTVRKAQQVRDSCRRLSAECLVFAYDSTKAIAESVDPLRTTQQGPPFNPGTFDKVLLDAPCSALGQRPQLFNKLSVKQLKSYPSLQRQLFEAAVELARPGGEILYSTCSVTHAENEGLVAWALRRHAGTLTLLPPRQRMASVVAAVGFPADLSDELRLCVQRFGPPAQPQDHYWDSVGFFIARFKKKL